MLSVGKIDYLIFTIDYGASDAVLKWVGELCDEYKDYHAIITTHCYLFRDGTTLDQGDVCPPATTGGHNNGDHMWDKLISKHENILMVISGHDPCDQIIVAQDEGDNGNIVTQMLVDPQGADAQLGGLGMVAILYFSEDGREVSVEYYSTIKEKFYMGANQFTMTLDMEETAPIDPPTPPDAPDTPDEGDSTQTQPDDTPDDPAYADDAKQDLPDDSSSKGLSSGMLVVIIVAVALVSLGGGVVVTLLIVKKKS
jgi:hypothetical protein